MKSIENTLKLVESIIDKISKHDVIDIALIGGYAVIAHGVERTTSDVDLCIYSEAIDKKNSRFFFNALKKATPDCFTLELREGSRDPGDPFKHDIIIFNDNSAEYPRIDFIIARYKWELEGLKLAKTLEDIPFLVIPKPYLIGMKLKAGSIKDDFDISELYKLLTEEEKKETLNLAKKIRRNKKLKMIIQRSLEQPSINEDDNDMLIR